MIHQQQLGRASFVINSDFIDVFPRRNVPEWPGKNVGTKKKERERERERVRQRERERDRERLTGKNLIRGAPRRVYP